MKNLVSVITILLFSTLGYAQNKSLGVGISTPNPNAALHVESPTGNQGFIMPRLTSAQRTAPGFQGVLSAADAGLMVYDTDVKEIYVWDGAAWGGAAKLSTPYKDSTSVGPNGGNLFDLRYNGPDTVGLYAGTNYNPNNPFAIYFGVNAGGRAYYGQTNGSTHAAATFRVLNGASTRPAVEGVTNSNTPASSGVYGGATGTGANAGYFQITNAANNKAALVGETNGLGNAGRFSTTNSTNTAHALFAQSNADTLGAAIHGNNIGNGFGVFGKSAGTKFASAAVYGEHVGTGDAAGAFRINNVANPNAAVYAETNGNTGAAVTARQIGTAGGHAGYFQVGDATNITGTGAAVFGVQFGTGRAGQFQISNNASTSAALRGFTNGLSNAGFFTVNNPVNDAPALMGETNGVGAAVYGINSGPGDSFSPAGHFVVNNATNNHAAIQGNNSGNGPAGRFLVESASNTASAVDANTIGTGGAGNFTINNATSGANAVGATTNGSGNALAAINNGTGFGVYARATGATDAVYAVKQGGDGTGSAGNFQNQNTSNGASTLFAMTNAGTGTAIGAINSANGNAFAIFTGGMRVSTSTISTPGPFNITTRAAAYLFDGTAASPYTFDASVVLNEGDIFYFYNSTASGITVNGVSISSNAGKTMIYLGGQLRGL